MTYLKPGTSTKVFNELARRVAMVLPLWDVHTLRADWVRNIRAAGQVRLGQKGTFVEYVSTEVPVAEREPVITAYRKKAGREVEQYWKKLPDPADHPLFRLTPA
jgi:hypothetical protein